MRRPRINLITLIVAVNVAGILLWANVHERRRSFIVDGNGAYEATVWKYGWPITLVKRDIWERIGRKERSAKEEKPRS